MRRQFSSLLVVMFGKVTPALALVAGLTGWALPVLADQYQYDAQGRLTQVTYANGGITAYTYDAKGNILAILSSLSTGLEDISDGGERFDFTLGQNTPNPGAGLMVVRFSVPSRAHTTLRVFDVRGRLVMTPVDGTLNPGAYTIRITASNLSGGVYYYKLESAGKRITRRLVVLP
jgi:YD repeat-containing protein